MYPRNASIPPTLTLGQILLLADGTIQTTGASVRVKIGTGAWGAGAGTLACDATSGEWTYTPTQAETADAFFLVVAYKTDCTSRSLTVITSASATAGYAGLDWSKITSPTSTVGLSGTTIKTATDIETDTVDIQSRIPTALDNGRMVCLVDAVTNGVMVENSFDSDYYNAVQSGLSTLNAAGVRTALGMAAADMDTQLDAILAASGGDGVIVAPLVQTDSQRNTPAYIECNQYDVSTLGPFRVETASGAQFNFANQTDWIIVVWDKDDNELGVVAYNDIDFSSSTSNAVMDQYSFVPSAAQVATAGRHTFSIRRPRGTTEQAPIVGVFNVIRCPRGPAA